MLPNIIYLLRIYYYIRIVRRPGCAHRGKSLRYSGAIKSICTYLYFFGDDGVYFWGSESEIDSIRTFIVFDTFDQTGREQIFDRAQIVPHEPYIAFSDRNGREFGILHVPRRVTSISGEYYMVFTLSTEKTSLRAGPGHPAAILRPNPKLKLTPP